ncbi:DUF423 domain-containing protein [Cognatilysobacter segetis]|uniref:DUF423 domain-containing protein n=1 Tax=Cognatilysobacter segetis TaxID=2492394 RepID=UPI001EE4624C|nr:DUF423 domain-containing protein [Lysobacter segetis]
MRHRRRSSDRMSPRGSGVFGALAGAAGVALAAYAAHAATGEAQRWLYTAAAMALVHGVLLVAYVPGGPRLGGMARLALVAGVLLFSGSLVAAHAFGYPTRLAPVGGSLLIAGWLLVALDRARG